TTLRVSYYCTSLIFQVASHWDCLCYKMRWRGASPPNRELLITARSRCACNFITTSSISEKFRGRFLFHSPRSPQRLFGSRHETKSKSEFPITNFFVRL